MGTDIRPIEENNRTIEVQKYEHLRRIFNTVDKGLLILENISGRR